MNYYPRHIGDFVSATAHLSMIEDGAYNRLLDWYYLDERPLPADRRLIYRRVRALTKPEQQAVDAVLDEFFELTDDNYRNTRCDEEIAKWQEKSGKARTASAQRWSERNANGHANAYANALPNAPPDGQPNAPPDAHANAPPNAYANAMPRVRGTNNQEPRTKNQPRSKAARYGPKSHRVPPDFAVTDALRAWAATQVPNVDTERETARMRDHEFREPRSDWAAAWRNWMRLAGERQARNGSAGAAAHGPPRPPTEGKYSATIRGLTGRDRQPETIDVESREIPAPPARRLG